MPLRTNGKFTTVGVSLATKTKLQALADLAGVAVYELVDTLATEELERRGVSQGVLPRMPGRRHLEDVDMQMLETAVPQLAALLRVSAGVLHKLGIDFEDEPGVTTSVVDMILAGAESQSERNEPKQRPALLPGLSPGAEAVR